MVYGREISGIGLTRTEFGIYAYNLDLDIKEINTIGYKKYERVLVGDWITSGMKFNEWTITEEGYLVGDATYTKEMVKDTKDDEMNFAIQVNPYRDNYIVSATTAGSRSRPKRKTDSVWSFGMSMRTITWSSILTIGARTAQFRERL